MKKFIFAAALIAASVSMNAQDYNRVALSYDYTGLNFNKEMDWFGTDKAETLGTNGFGLNYIHGFGVANNMFVEVGANVDFLFGSRTETYYDEEASFKTQNINLQVPVNFVYRFNITEGVSIDPYVGLNFKLHFTDKYKETYKDEDGEESSKWISFFDDGEDAMGSKDATWNRFQMGWHVGVGVNYEKYYLGVQVGTDFIPAYSHEFKYGGESYKCKVNTTNVKVSLGYTF